MENVRLLCANFKMKNEKRERNELKCSHTFPLRRFSHAKIVTFAT